MKPVAEHFQFSILCINDHVAVYEEETVAHAGLYMFNEFKLHIVPFSALAAKVPHERAVFTHEYWGPSRECLPRNAVFSDDGRELFTIVLQTEDPGTSESRDDGSDVTSLAILRVRAEDDTFERITSCQRFELRSDLAGEDLLKLLRACHFMYVNGLQVLHHRNGPGKAAATLHSIAFVEQAGGGSYAHLSENTTIAVICPDDFGDHECGLRFDAHWVLEPTYIAYLADLTQKGYLKGVTGDGRRVVFFKRLEEDRQKDEPRYAFFVHDFPSGKRHSLAVQIPPGASIDFHKGDLLLAPSGNTVAMTTGKIVYVVHVSSDIFWESLEARAASHCWRRLKPEQQLRIMHEAPEDANILFIRLCCYPND